MAFTSVPVLDLSLASDPDTKPQFLSDLRHALMEVGFLYLKNVGISDDFFGQVVAAGRSFFDLPLEEKLKIEMKNAPSFLGYSRLSAEVTAGAADHREQIDLGTEPHAGWPPGPGEPLYHHLLGPNQWPSEAALPGFRDTFAEYMRCMGDVSRRFTSLIAEAIELPPAAFDRYFDADQQHKLKIVRYPDSDELGLGAEEAASRQGVGPHKDSMLTSYLLQASAHRGLQVQNARGRWVDAPPLDGTLVVAMGQGLEALTRGVCRSTTHRVLSPGAGEGARFSIPFFQGVRGSATFDELDEVGVGNVPDEVRRQRRRIDEEEAGGGHIDDVEFTFRKGGPSRTLGEATLRNRVRSHPDVGERWFPDLLRDIRAQEAKEAGADRGGVVGAGGDGQGRAAEVDQTIAPAVEVQ